MVIDVKKKNLYKCKKMKHNRDRRVWKLKETREKFKDKMKKLVNTEAKDL